MSDQKEKTVVAIVLDRSGSMCVTLDATIRGYNEYIQQIKEDAKQTPTEVCLVTFNGEVYEHYWKESPEKLVEISDRDYIPTGSTAMYDALYYTINKLQSEDDNNTAYLLVIISDGEENSSKHTNVNAVKETIESCKKNDCWTVTYMGCDESYLRNVSQQTGIPLANMAVWTNATGESASFGYAKSRESMKKYMRSRASGMKCCASFYNEDANDLADFSEVDSSSVDSSSVDSSSVDSSPAPPPPQPPVSAMYCTSDVVTGATESSKYFAGAKPVEWNFDKKDIKK